MSEALEKSIAKWVSIAEGIGIDAGGRNCSLCITFYNYKENKCEGCPICELTGEEDCDGTPYQEWAAHHRNEHYQSKYKQALCPTCKDIAKKEVQFLKGLRRL